MSEWEKLVDRFLNEYVPAWHEWHNEPCTEQCMQRVRISLTTHIYPDGRSASVEFVWTSDATCYQSLGAGETIEEAIKDANRTIDIAVARQRNRS